MRALVQDRYGSPDVLRIDEVPKPVPGPGQVLVRVSAASVNARDWHVMRGEPRMARAMDRSTFGRSGPKVRTPGTDFAGTVESVGEGVSQRQAGDAVFGESVAAFAEYILARQDFIASVPAEHHLRGGVRHPHGCQHRTHLPTQGRSQGRRPGSLSTALRAASARSRFSWPRAWRLMSPLSSSGRNGEQARSLGADAVVDYGTEDFCEFGEQSDVVLDLVGNRSRYTTSVR